MHEKTKGKININLGQNKMHDSEKETWKTEINLTETLNKRHELEDKLTNMRQNKRNNFGRTDTFYFFIRTNENNLSLGNRDSY